LIRKHCGILKEVLNNAESGFWKFHLSTPFTMPITILWADDEIDLLKPQLLYLRDKGYDVIPVTNGQDALEAVDRPEIDLVFLDENMPGLSGLETLTGIKSKRPNLPVVMITKNEAEDLMEEAIGSQITDYLIKPVKPQQILMTIKKITDNQRLVTEKTNSAYQQEFQRIFSSMHSDLDAAGWADVYRNLVYWELELDRSRADQMKEVLSMQKQEANVAFFKFIDRNYVDWVQHGSKSDAPVMSHNVLEKKLFPLLDDIPTYLLVIDNLRYDQFRIIQPMLEKHFRMVEEDYFYSILPTATQYSRNALFAGLMPSEIEKKLPKLWLNDEDEGGKNMFEKELLADNLARHRLNIRSSYLKIVNNQAARNLHDEILHGLDNTLNVIVYNFVDMLSHARTEMEVLKELASDESAYRSLTESWFEHSPLFDALKRLEDRKVRIIVTTDHGTIRVRQPSKVVGDRNTTTNLRYKSGKNLQYSERDVLEVREPAEAKLPRQHVSSTFIFAKEDLFFVYPNNFNHYVNYFRDTFQHGGVSLEEIIVPYAVFTQR